MTAPADLALQQGGMPYRQQTPAECLSLDHQVTIGKPTQCESTPTLEPHTVTEDSTVDQIHTEPSHSCVPQPTTISWSMTGNPPILLLSWNSRSTTHPDRRETQKRPST
jgi:hypothetical protein